MAGSLHAFIDRDARLAELAETSNALGTAQRIEAVRSLRPRDLERLWAMAEGLSGVAQLSFLVPEDVPPGHTVEWVGKNSLPAFSRFTKRFCRGEEPGTLVGQNTGPLQWLIGPGYFTVRVRPDGPGALQLDYTRPPRVAPPGWPKVKSNDRGIGRLVFGDMVDFLRPIGDHMAIGAAFRRNGQFRGQYFALARGEVLPPGPARPV